MCINFYSNIPSLETWGQNIQGAKHSIGAQQPGGKRPRVKHLGDDIDLGRNVSEPFRQQSYCLKIARKHLAKMRKCHFRTKFR